jgi:hypothetical protein
MWKSCPNFKPTYSTLEKKTGGTAFPHQPFAALDKPAPAVCGQAITGYLLEGSLPLDGGLAPHQPVVPSLHGLRLRADRDCAGLAGGG